MFTNNGIPDDEQLAFIERELAVVPPDSRMYPVLLQMREIVRERLGERPDVWPFTWLYPNR